MSDVFIGAAGDDRPTAERLAGLLQQHGWSVWWDREPPSDKPLDIATEEALAAATCVVVLWSRAAVTSQRVQSAARAGAGRGILVVVRLDRQVELPPELHAMQTADLSDWQEGTGAQTDRLLRVIASRVHAKVPPRSPHGGAAGWRVTKLHLDIREAAFKVQLSHEQHVVRFGPGTALAVGVEGQPHYLLLVDDVVVRERAGSAYSLEDNVRMEFALTDGEASLPAVLEVAAVRAPQAAGWLHRHRRVGWVWSFHVAGELLYQEELASR